MIQKETITINGSKFERTYSDENLYIEREGVKYAEAVDPVGIDRRYTETDIPIESEGN